MDFEEALVYELQAIQGLGGRIYPSQADENMKPPFVVYISSEGESIMTLSGPTNLTELTCEIHILTETYEDLKTYTKAVLDRIKSFFQRSIGQNGPTIKSVSHIEPSEDFEKGLDYHRSTFDIRVRF